MEDSIAQQSQEVKSDSYNWPFNSATGQSYTFDERIADPTPPLPRPGSLVKLARDKTAGKATVSTTPKIRHRSRKPFQGINYAAPALGSSSPLDDGMKATARRMDEHSTSAPPRRIPWFVNGEFKKMLEVL